MNSIKNKFLRFTNWAQKEWLAIVIFSVMVAMFFLYIVLISWVAGYWLKALYGMNFELNSCWQGVTAVGAALGLIAALAKAAWSKYSTDSQYNSKAGEKPTYAQHIAEVVKEAAKDEQPTMGRTGR